MKFMVKSPYEWERRHLVGRPSICKGVRSRFCSSDSAGVASVEAFTRRCQGGICMMIQLGVAGLGIPRLKSLSFCEYGVAVLFVCIYCIASREYYQPKGSSRSRPYNYFGLLQYVVVSLLSFLSSSTKYLRCC